ncbi:MAG: hypothetical protein V3R57_03815, partial [Candidatus Bathyarchaeia archaeon]
SVLRGPSSSKRFVVSTALILLGRETISFNLQLRLAIRLLHPSHLREYPSTLKNERFYVIQLKHLV